MKRYSITLCSLLVLWTTSYGQTYKKIASLPGAANYGYVSFSIGDRLYCGGGFVKTFFQYDQHLNVWIRKADIPGVDTARTFGIGFSIGSKGYVGLGTDGDQTLVFKKDLWEYDPATDSWTQKADFPHGAFAGSGVFVVNGKAYVGGGGDKNFNYSEFYQYDPVADDWSPKRDLPVDARGYPAMFSIGKYGYLMGGEGKTELSDFYQYDPSFDQWTALPDFPGAARSQAAAFAIGGRGYVGLGQSNYTAVYKDMYTYDTAKSSWQKLSDLPGPGRAAPSVSVLGDTAYMGSGFNYSSGLLADWYSFVAPDAAVSNSQTTSATVMSYPQPVFDRLSFAHLEANTFYKVEVIDMLGRSLLQTSVHTTAAGDPSLNVSGLRPGLYRVVLSTESSSVAVSVLKQ
ncbi:MAG: T9SS type A sorting domain-containing protein [Bacteroidetes bacterium]|nr:T9SS type A sorting domain-containing protein [Bacteroidota bacterium]